jgi:hypothetical protein
MKLIFIVPLHGQVCIDVGASRFVETFHRARPKLVGVWRVRCPEDDVVPIPVDVEGSPAGFRLAFGEMRRCAAGAGGDWAVCEAVDS